MYKYSRRKVNTSYNNTGYWLEMTIERSKYTMDKYSVTPSVSRYGVTHKCNCIFFDEEPTTEQINQLFDRLTPVVEENGPVAPYCWKL
jgi:hypothetical protein